MTLSGPTLGQVVQNAITEWWIGPTATFLTGPRERTVFGGIATNGDIIVAEMDHASGGVQRAVVGDAAPNDHNAPALWAAPGRRMVMARSKHGASTLMWFRVSDVAGSVSSMAAAPDVTYDFGAGTSYAQLHRVRHLSDAAQDTFVVFCRVTLSSWRSLTFSVNQATGGITFGPVTTLLTATGQTYISTADAHAAGNQVIRFAWGYNPTAARSAVRYVEIDLVNGAITSPVDPTVTANLSGAGLPLVDDAIAPLLPDAPAGFSRRLFYVRPGPAAPAVSYADWPTSDPDNAVYRVTSSAGGGSWATTEYGASGTRIGYTDGSNYIAGMSFPNPALDDTVAVARIAGGVSTVERHTAGAVTMLASDDTYRLARPTFPVDGGGRVLACQVTFYGSMFTEYAANVVALYPDSGERPPVITEARGMEVLCGELRTGRILTSVPVSAASWDQRLCEAGSISATIPVLSREVAARPELFLGLEGARSYLAVVYKGAVLEAGPIWVHDYDGGESVQVQATGLWALWSHRRVMKVLATAGERANPQRTSLSWSGMSLGTIAKNLVATAMSHLGGSAPVDLPPDASGTSSRTYPGHELASVDDRLREIMEVRGGPEIAFQPYLTTDGLGVRWEMLTGGAAGPMLRQSGPDWEWDTTVARSQVAGIRVRRDWSNLSMRAWATGQGQDESLLMLRAENTDLIERGYPLLESASSHSNVSVRSTLLGHAQAGLRRGVRPQSEWSMTVRADGSPSLQQYRPGHFAQIRVRDDHPYLRHYVPGGWYRSRITGIRGDLSQMVDLTFQPEVDAR